MITHLEETLATTKQKSETLILTNISNGIQGVDSACVWSHFIKKINTTLELVKDNFQKFVEEELINAANERRELLLVVRSELNSPLWQLRMIKMQQGRYKIFREFKIATKFQNAFSSEQNLVKYFVKKDNKQLALKITEGFKVIFENTNSAKYANVDKWFEMFATNLEEEFGNYTYIAWEKVLIDLRKEKPLDFPPLNDILRRVEKVAIPTKEVAFLKELNLIN